MIPSRTIGKTIAVADEPHRPERVAHHRREHGRDGRHRGGDDEARLVAGREAALRPRGLEAGEVRMRREREARDEIASRVQCEEEDRQHRVDRDDRERAEDDVRPDLLAPAGPHRSSLRSPMRSMIAARMKIASASTVAIAAAYPDPVEQERVLVHVHRGDDRGVPRPAGGRVVDDVEAAQGVDRRQDEGDEDLVAEPRQRHREELAEGAGAVDARRVVELERDLLHARDEQHHAQAEGDPGADHADRRQRPREVAEPRPDERPEPEQVEQAVQRAVRVVHPRERLRDHDTRDQLRQEEGRAEEAEAPDLSCA